MSELGNCIDNLPYMGNHGSYEVYIFERRHSSRGAIHQQQAGDAGALAIDHPYQPFPAAGFIKRSVYTKEIEAGFGHKLVLIPTI